MIPTVGIDLSLTATGVARSDGECSSVGQDGLTRLSIDQQIGVLNQLADRIIGFAAGGRLEPPTAVCIEGLDMAQSYGGQIERSVLWWKVVERFVRWGSTVYVAPSAQVKMNATGKGSGPKGAVIDALTRRWPQFDHRGDHNLADASVCALIAAHMLGAPIIPSNWPDGQMFKLPDTHLRALKSVRSTAVPPPLRKRRMVGRGQPDGLDRLTAQPIDT